MPRNFTGGKGHRSGQNSESSALNKHKKLFENLLDDIRTGEDLEGVFIGRVTRKFGDGRTEVVYFHEDRMYTIQAIIKGSLRGRGKRDAFVDLNSIVLLVDLGVDSGTTHEIMTVFTAEQIATLRKEVVMDDRLFLSESARAEDNIEFEEEIEIDKI